jgi:hypothetical protein
MKELVFEGAVPLLYWTTPRGDTSRHSRFPGRQPQYFSFLQYSEPEQSEAQEVSAARLKRSIRRY